MSVEEPNLELTMESRNSHNGSSDRLGLSFTIDYLLFNSGVKGSKGEVTASSATEQTENNMLNDQNPELKEVEIHRNVQGTLPQDPDLDTGKSKTEEEWNKEKHEEGEEEMTTTSCSSDKSSDKPNQSYIALISKAILASEEKKLLLCDIYQWIMDHYPYFKSRKLSLPSPGATADWMQANGLKLIASRRAKKDKNWRNSVRHNLSLNDCFIKAGRSDNGKGHFWAIHPANYQDFSKGDYQCRRARRRVRRVAAQIRLSSLTSPYHPAATLTLPHRTTCWCCPQIPTLPLSCLTPRLYWPWSSMHPQVGLHLGLNPSLP
ncbi:forkhead box Q2 isoform X2 [Poecilia reticulata]|uniref:forkhead box Q2 isoform X2 n=1 Tax=Poecilia reticulata TaxID=8081 RepID=UPI0004A42DF3|nr:PREDICTED: forkhead box protein D5-A-like isoform X2 [Poecilia reticulata]